MKFQLKIEPEKQFICSHLRINNSGRYLLSLLLVCATLFIIPGISRSALGTEEAPADHPNVVILTIASVRNHETIDDTQYRFMPGFFKKLADEGFLYSNLVEKNFEIHMPAVQAINSGVKYPESYTSLRKPSLFQYIIKNNIAAPDEVWSIGHWSPHDYILETPEFNENTFPSSVSFAVDYRGPEGVVNDKEFFCGAADIKRREKYGMFFNWPHWDTRSRLMHGIAVRVLSELRPRFMHYVMQWVEVAHHGSYPEYAVSLAQTDRQIREVWDIIRTDPFYSGNTYLIVNVDHGRDEYYMHHSEWKFTPERNVWMYIYGPGIRKGASSEETVYHTDIFKTVAEIYALETHSSEGRFLKSCFEPGYFED